MADQAAAPEDAITLETATVWARSNREWDKVYRYLFLHPNDFFVVSPPRRWPIAHQVVYHGDVDLFKRILVLLDNQVNICSKSTDDKTLLDVATERKDRRALMYTYVKHLFAQDQLLKEAEQNNWRAVTDILDGNRDLANQKPPYARCFLLHCVVQNSNAEFLKDLLNRYQFLTNVLNTETETPLDMARRLNKPDICAVLQPITLGQSFFAPNQSQTPPSTPTPTPTTTTAAAAVAAVHVQGPNQPLTAHSPSTPPSGPPKSQQVPSTPVPPSKPVDPPKKWNCVELDTSQLKLAENGNFTVGSDVLFNSAFGPPPPPLSPSQPPIKQQQNPPSSNGIPRVITRKSIISPCTPTDSDPPPPPTSTPTSEQLIKNLTCSLTRRIFVDPVIASDGQTYERAAITSWINEKHSSPVTGAPMDATFRDNIEIKNIIQSIQRLSQK